MFNCKRACKMMTLVLLSLVLIVSGCWASKFTLISADKAAVNLAFVGDWDVVNSKGDHVSMIVRNLDGKMYYIEWQGAGDEKAARYVGITADVKGGTFAHLRGIPDDGSIPGEWLIMRIDLSGDRLNVRQLNEEFFKPLKIDSAEALRKVLEENISNDAMYDKEEAVTGMRVAR